MRWLAPPREGQYRVSVLFEQILDISGRSEDKLSRVSDQSGGILRMTSFDNASIINMGALALARGAKTDHQERCHAISSNPPGDAGHGSFSDDDLSPGARRRVPKAAATEQEPRGLAGIGHRGVGGPPPHRPLVAFEAVGCATGSSPPATRVKAVKSLTGGQGSSASLAAFRRFGVIGDRPIRRG